MELVSIIGYAAGVFTTIAVIPQIYKAIKTGKTDDISPGFFIILLLGVGLRNHESRLAHHSDQWDLFDPERYNVGNLSKKQMEK